VSNGEGEEASPRGKVFDAIVPHLATNLKSFGRRAEGGWFGMDPSECRQSEITKFPAKNISANQEARRKREDRRPVCTDTAAAATASGARTELSSAGAAAAAGGEKTARLPARSRRPPAPPRAQARGCPALVWPRRPWASSPHVLEHQPCRHHAASGTFVELCSAERRWQPLEDRLCGASGQFYGRRPYLGPPLGPTRKRHGGEDHGRTVRTPACPTLAAASPALVARTEVRSFCGAAASTG